MYKLLIANKRTKKRLKNYIESRNNIKEKLDKLKINPRTELDAHPLHGKIKGKWSCWLGSNIRLIYRINDINKEIIIEAIRTHQIY